LALLRRPVWLLGVVADAGGFVCLAVALGAGELVEVQPIAVTVLLFALPLSARLGARRVAASEWRWAGVLTACLVVIVVVGDASQGRDEASSAAWTWVGLLVGGATGVAVLAAGRATGPRRALLFGVAAGALFGVMDALTKTVVRSLDDGVLEVLATWPLWALVVLLVVGTSLQQASYQAGELKASLPAITALEPVVGMVIGVTVFGERFRAHGPVEVAALVAALALGAVATLTLARSQGEADAGAVAVTVAGLQAEDRT